MMKPDPLAVFAADVGSVQSGHFGWAAIVDGLVSDGDHPEGLASAMKSAASSGFFLALGMECPLFIPCPDEESSLGKQRIVDTGMAWSTQIASGATMMGLQQLCWILTKVKEGLSSPLSGTLALDDFQNGKARLFIWEAFVSGKSKTPSHKGDARLAAQTFLQTISHRSITGSLNDQSVISIAGLVLLWAGCSTDLSVLKQPTIVIKP